MSDSGAESAEVKWGRKRTVMVQQLLSLRTEDITVK